MHDELHRLKQYKRGSDLLYPLMLVKGKYRLAGAARSLCPAGADGVAGNEPNDFPRSRSSEPLMVVEKPKAIPALP
jgi:hypothetical protein